MNALQGWGAGASRAQVDALEKQRDALEAALLKIADICDPKIFPEQKGHDAILWIGDIARDALSRATGGETP